MTALRIVLATRRFWPQADWPETNMARLAAGFQRCGAQVTIVSARWGPDWPTESTFQGMPLIRLKNPNGRMWGTVCYVRALGRWLGQHRSEYDLVCASRLRFDAYAALGARKRTAIPVVLRADGGGAMGDCQWQQRAVLGGRIRRRCMTADAIIASDRTVADELTGAAYAENRIHCIAAGLPAVASRTRSDRIDARLALAEANADLTVANDAPVAVFAGRLHSENGLFALLRTWQHVRRHRPDARLWLIGDGPLRGELYQRIGDLDLRQRVFMPGSCEDLQEVLRAADVVVHAGPQSGVPQTVLEAIATGVPVVVAATPDNEESAVLLGPHARLGRSSDTAAFAQSILDTLDQPPSPESLNAARRRVLVEHSLSAMARAHLALFRQLVTRRL